MLEHKDIHWFNNPTADVGRRTSYKVHQPDGSVATRSLLGVGGGWAQLYVGLKRDREQAWADTVAQFEAAPDIVAHAFIYIAEHPMFYAFQFWGNGRDAPLAHERHLDHESGWRYVWVAPHLVNPVDGRPPEDPSLPSEWVWWLEAGPTLFRYMEGKCTQASAGRDAALGLTARTFEQGVVELAEAIHAIYGNDRRVVMEKWNDPELPTEPPADDA
jgi:hypothetical protein